MKPSPNWSPVPGNEPPQNGGIGSLLAAIVILALFLWMMWIAKDFGPP